MTLGEYWADAPRGTGRVTFRTGPFIVRASSDRAGLLEHLAQVYAETSVMLGPTVVHVDARVSRVRGPRRWLHPQVSFLLDGTSPFAPFPASHAYPLFEWGLNWAIATRAHHYLMLHAAVVERAGQALILPGVPGSGKSTLCAALSLRGWRLLTDEQGLIERHGPGVHPIPRAIPLKNASIDVIRRFGGPGLKLGPIFEKTRKGDVSHLPPSPESLRRQLESAAPGWILFPRYVPGRAVRIEPLPDQVAFNRLTQNAFNYRLLGEDGFVRLTQLVRQCRSFAMVHSDLREALAAIDDLVAGRGT